MRALLTVFFMVLVGYTFGQRKIVQQVKESVTATESEAHLTFLASNEMRGRDTGSPEIDIAANYLRTQLKIYGATPVPDDTSFFQTVPLDKILPAETASLIIGSDSFKLKDDL